MIILIINTYLILLFIKVTQPEALIIYPLDGPRSGRDISRSKNPNAKRRGVSFGPGPDGRRRGSTRFTGRKYSYVEVPYTRKIDAKNSMTILAWIYHTGNSGPIVNYNRRGWGVHFWMVGRRKLFVRFVTRRRKMTAPVVSNKVNFKAWNYVGATYDKRTGVAKLYINSVPVASRRIGKFSLATNYPIRIGAQDGDGRRFKGRIFCVQVYGTALNSKQMRKLSRKCFMKGNVIF